ncbi:hypothetical protein, partial [Aeromonas caviae]|uniref:hypothetical protein n=1 Tax=Aeromonas caviae TaxID=648 RepID=UPI001CC54331
TYGSNGWHLHTHEMWLVDLHQDADEAREIILKRWRAASDRSSNPALAQAARQRFRMISLASSAS